MANCLRTVSVKRQPVSQFVSRRKHVGLSGSLKALDAARPHYSHECRFLIRFLMTRTTPSLSSCRKKKMHPGCTYTMNKRYSTVSLEASDWNESCCCMLEKYEDFRTQCKQADDGEKLSYLVLDSYSPAGRVSHSSSPVVLAVKSLGTMSDDIILWDADRVGGAVLKLECLQNDTAAVFLDVEKQMLLFGDETVKTSPKTVPESLGKPSEGQLLRVKEVLANSLPKLFVKRLEYSVYHQNIVFENNLIGKRTVGLAEYMQQMSLLKIIGHFKFAYVNMEILKITIHPEDSSIKVRWRIKGVSGLKIFITFWKFRLWRLKEIFERQDAWYDGFSTFYVGQDGLIYKHVADKMMPDSDRVAAEEQKTDMTAKLALFTGLVVRPSLRDVFPLAFNKKSSSRLSDMILPIHRLE